MTCCCAALNPDNPRALMFTGMFWYLRLPVCILCVTLVILLVGSVVALVVDQREVCMEFLEYIFKILLFHIILSTVCVVFFTGLFLWVKIYCYDLLFGFSFVHRTGF